MMQIYMQKTMQKIKKCSNVKIKLNDPDFISIIKNEISNYYNLDISDIHITNVLDKYLIIDLGSLKNKDLEDNINDFIQDYIKKNILNNIYI